MKPCETFSSRIGATVYNKALVYSNLYYNTLPALHTQEIEKCTLLYSPPNKDTISFFITRPWKILRAARGHFFIFLINYLTYLHVTAGRMAAIVEFCPTHRRSRPEIQKRYLNAAILSQIPSSVNCVSAVIFLWRWRTKFAQSASQSEARADIPEEMSQTILANKYQGNLYR